MELIAPADVTTLLGNVSTGITTTGASLWAVVAVAVAIPLTFYVIHKIMGLFPSVKGRKA